MMAIALVPGPFPLDIVTIGDHDRLDRLRALTLGLHRFAGHIGADGATRADRNRLGARLDRAIADAQGRVLLVAEGTGCFAAAWWGRLTPVDQVARVAGALFYSPTEDSEAARLAARHFRSPRMPLPFPSLLIERRAALAGDELLAHDWGSRAFGMVDDHPTPFARARRMVARFTAGVVERDAMRADRLRGVDRSRT
jgi:uncharacterized protein